MRSYIFTKNERAEVEKWLRTGERNTKINRILFEANQNRHTLLADIKLLIALLALVFLSFLLPLQ